MRGPIAEACTYLLVRYPTPKPVDSSLEEESLEDLEGPRKGLQLIFDR